MSTSNLERQRVLEELKKKEREISTSLASVQGLGSLSQLNDDLAAVQKQIRDIESRDA